MSKCKDVNYGNYVTFLDLLLEFFMVWLKCKIILVGTTDLFCFVTASVGWGKVIVSVCPHPGGVPTLAGAGYPKIGTPSQGRYPMGQFRMGSPQDRYPPGQGRYPPGKNLLHGRRYASCVHARGLSCFKKFWEDVSVFRGATDIPVFGLLVMSPLGFKVRVDPSLACFITCMQQVPQIHFWCDTCWPLDEVAEEGCQDSIGRLICLSVLWRHYYEYSMLWRHMYFILQRL